MTSVVRNVIIKTRIQSDGGTGGGRGSSSGGSGGTSSMSAVRGEKTVTKEKQKQLQHVRGHAKLLARIHKDNLKNIKAEAQMRLESRRNAERELRTQRAKTREIMKQARLQDSYQKSARLQRIRRQVSNELAYRQGTGQPLNIGGRSAGFRSGAGVNRGGEGANYFSTGIPMLDKANQVGFQAFITTMTIRMIGQAMGGMMKGAAGLSGEGNGIIAQGVRAVSGDARSRNDPIRTFFRDTIGDIIRGFGGADGAELVGLGIRGQRLIEGGQKLTTRASAMAQGRYTSGMRREDELIREKRSLLREEIDVLRQRVQADQALVNAAMGKREAAIQSFGRDTRAGQDMSLSIARKFNSGKNTPSDFTSEERQHILSRPAQFGHVSEVWAHNSAMQGKRMQPVLDMWAGGGSIDSNMFDAMKQARTSSRRLVAAEQYAKPIFNAQLNIEKLQLESQEIIDGINNLLAPLWEKELEQLRKEVEQFEKRLIENYRTGGGVGAAPTSPQTSWPRLPGGMAGR